MTFPPGVTLCEVVLPASATWQGGASTITATLTPTRGPIHRVTDTPLAAITGTGTGPSGAGLSLLVPRTQQPGYRDAAGNSISTWEYDAVVTYRDTANVAQTVSKRVRIPSSLESLDILTATDYKPVANRVEVNIPARLAETSLNATYASYVNLAKNPDTLIAGAVTLDGSDLVTSAVVTWPNGQPGTLTITGRDANGAVLGYNITYGSPVTKTFTQPTITRNANGAATLVPQIVVS